MRRQIQRTLIDPLQFRFDVFPGLRYQPLPWLGYADANRSAGTAQRWAVMRDVLLRSGSRTGLDIGCNVGFFCFAMAQMGIASTGVESGDKEFRIASFARRKMAAANVGLLSLHVDERTVVLLPCADAVLLLSVWHHWVKHLGFDAGTRTLHEVWQRTQKVMFFETGEAEMPADYGLPEMSPDAGAWLTRYLSDTCSGGRVEWLGKMSAFAPGGSDTEGAVQRNFFAVWR